MGLSRGVSVSLALHLSVSLAHHPFVSEDACATVCGWTPTADLAYNDRHGVVLHGRCGVLYPDEEESGRFDGFGGSWLAAGRTLPAREFLPGRTNAESRRLVRENCPAAPGVYGMIDADDRLIYVGKSKSLRDRLSSYFAGRSADPKARRIIGHTKRLVWESAPHEFTALVRELELIRRWCPRFNVRGQPGRIRRAYVGLGRGPAAHAYVTEKPSGRDRLLLGPLRPTRELRRMVRQVNDYFRLRDCPDKTPVSFSDQLELFPADRAPRCMRHDLGACLGPCGAKCSHREYNAKVRAARAFLSGGDTGVLDRLEKEMLAAAAAAQYERAAALRDVWQDLGALGEQIERLKMVRREYAFIYPLPSYGAGETWHLIHRGQLMAVISAPGSRRAARQALRALEQVYSSEETHRLPIEPDDPDLIHIVSTWFRTNPGEMDRTLPVEEARRIADAMGDVAVA